MPALIKPMLDGSFVDKDPQAMRTIPILLVLVFLVRGLANFSSTVSVNWISNKIVMNLRNKMFDKLLHMPNAYHDAHPSGTTLSKITFDATQVTSAATNVLVVLIKDSLAVVGLLAWMIYLNWKLSLIALLVAPITAVIVMFVSPRMRSLNRSLQGGMGKMTHILEESLDGNRIIKIFGGQAYEKKRFYDITNWVRRYANKIIVASNANVALVQLFTATSLAVIIYIASLESAANEITVGGFVSFFGAMAMLFSPIKRLTTVNEHLQRGLAACESVFALIDQPNETDEGSIKKDQFSGKLSLSQVTFSYPNTQTTALNNIDLTINPGETIALVGQSGSGKSTIAKLIPRFYDLQQGEICIDDVNINDIPLATLREQITVVTQDVVLFNDTVEANIAYGRLAQVSAEAIQAAARVAHALEFIQTLPDGFTTQVGQNGERLSGGQRQRVAIARAILKNAPILILDEATSALDTESERFFQQALDTLKKGKTTIIIAHRLSTIENADRIIVLDKGCIVESGTHQQLLQHNGYYAKLYNTQFS